MNFDDALREAIVARDAAKQALRIAQQRVTTLRATTKRRKAPGKHRDRSTTFGPYRTTLPESFVMREQMVVEWLAGSSKTTIARQFSRSPATVDDVLKRVTRICALGNPAAPDGRALPRWLRSQPASEILDVLRAYHAQQLRKLDPPAQ